MRIEQRITKLRRDAGEILDELYDKEEAGEDVKVMESVFDLLNKLREAA
jgi:HEPN domain-containing protein